MRSPRCTGRRPRWPAKPRRSGQPSTKNGEWPHYTADLTGSRYSPLDQINGANFSKLEVAWRFKTDNFGPFPEYKLEGTPLMVKGVLYTTAGTRRSVIALDAKTGELHLVAQPARGQARRRSRRASSRVAASPTGPTAAATSGSSTTRTGYRLVALNAKTGQPVASFGNQGVVDLKSGAIRGADQQIDLESGEIGIHSTPTVAGNTVIVGAAFREGMTVNTHNNTKGLVRAFDVRTGKQLWRFNTIPRTGEFGNDTWEENSWSYNGNTGVWTQISVDEELGLAYLPVETPTSDFYGGHRPGNNLFAETLVAVDLKTGQRKWHYQLVHHPIWNFDNCCASLLADVTINGKPRKVVAQPSKLGWLYVLDRATGDPIWPIEERPVPQSDVPGEKTSPTQPHPTKPPAYARNYLRVPDDVIDFTPELRQQALEVLKFYKYAPSPFNPPILGNVNGPLLGAIGPGTATNWPGSAYDPETAHRVRAGRQRADLVAHRSSSRRRDSPTSATSRVLAASRSARSSDPATAARPTRAGARATTSPAAEGAAAKPAAPAAPAKLAAQASQGLNVQGLSIVKPPYGVLTGRQPRSRRDRVAGAARRHTRQHPQSPGAARG